MQFGMHISMHKNSEIRCQISEQLKAVMHNLELHIWTLQWEIRQAVSIQNSHLDYNIWIQVTGSNNWISFRQQSQNLLEVQTDFALELHQQKTILGAPVSLMECRTNVAPNNFTIKSQGNYLVIGRTTKSGRLTVAQGFSMSCQGTGIGFPAVTETGCEMHMCCSTLFQLHIQTQCLNTVSVLLDTVYHSKHSSTLGDLQWKTPMSWNLNFILHILRHQATYKLSLFKAT